MDIVMFTGFLGSGKTTLALDFARFMTEAGRRISFVVNEAGDVSLDGALVKKSNYTVKEIFSGCICCTVTTELIEALKEIMASEQSDCILIEPSGVSDPVRLKELLLFHGYRPTAVINVVDLPRFDLLRAAAGPLIDGGLRSASFVLANKTDLIEDRASLDGILREVEQKIRRLLPERETKMYPVSFREGIPSSIWEEAIAFPPEDDEVRWGSVALRLNVTGMVPLKAFIEDLLLTVIAAHPQDSFHGHAKCLARCGETEFFASTPGMPQQVGWNPDPGGNSYPGLYIEAVFVTAGQFRIEAETMDKALRRLEQKYTVQILKEASQ